MQKNEKKRALIVGGGGLRGAYNVGVLKKIYEYYKPDYFDSIYAVSVGVYASTFYASGQVETMENTWRYYVHGNQLVNFSNLLKFRPILDLDYLIDLFKSEKSILDLEKLFKSKPKIFYVLTDYETGLAEYFNAKNENIFDLMKATAALPCVYPKKIYINGRRYFDGGASDSIPLRKAIEDGHTEIFLLLTRPEGYAKEKKSYLIPWLCLRSKNARKAIINRQIKYNETQKFIEETLKNKEIKLTVFRPDQLNIKRLSRERELIIDAIEKGKKDAEEILLNRTDNG